MIGADLGVGAALGGVGKRGRERGMTVTSERRPGRGWNTYAAILLIFAGAMQILDGLWALDRQDTTIDSLFWGDNLEAWGWVYIIGASC